MPAKTLGFDLPNSDILWFAAGAAYAFKTNMELSMGYTYVHYKDRTIKIEDENINSIVGSFKDTLYQTLTVSFTYRF